MKYSRLWNSEFQKNTAFIDRKSVNSALEIGSFEGLTSNYICDELLTPAGTMICIDPLSDNYSLDFDNEIFRGQYDRFMENTTENADKIFLIRKKSEQVLHLLRSDSFDLCYVDGHHRYDAVYFDGTEAFRTCKVGGYILFDDYLWNSATYEVKKAIDRVLEENPNHRLLLKLNQVLIQKLKPGIDTQDGQDEYQNKSVEVLFGWDKIYAAYANLDLRIDRNDHMKAELDRIGFSEWFVRRRSFPWQELYDNGTEEFKQKVATMHRRTAGALGCHYSQVAIMEEALRQGKHAWVNEDDLVFGDDMNKRLKIIYKFLNTHEWDIFWFGGTYHKEPTWHKSVEGKHTHPDMQVCNCLLNRDWEPTLNPNIVRTYGCFSTHSYLVNKDRVEHILGLLERNVHLSMGIDWIMLKEQPNLFTYAFDPGCVKQYDNQSNIGDGISVFSGFEQLGPHWWKNNM